MREMRFRAWDKINHTMGDVLSIDFADRSLRMGIGNKWIMIKMENCHLMQFIGIKDKNGVDLYEGDIVKTSHTSASTTTDVVEIVRDEIIGYLRYLEDGEVIGNIHENPELLK